MTFRFADPIAFQFLWLVPVLAILALLIRKRQFKELMRQLGEKSVPLLTASISSQKRNIKLILEVFCVVAMVFALARPQMGASKQKVVSQGVELMLVVDVSNSMLAEDAKPSRLELAKNELERLIFRLGGDKVGIIAFAGSAVLLSPITTDKSALVMFLNSLSPDAVSTQGTDFKRALAEAKSAFERGGLGGEVGTVVTRAIVIASDGEDNEAGAVAAAEELAKEGIRIFSLGFGTEKGSPIPMRDQRGNLLGYRKDRGGQVVMSQTKGTVLKELAKQGQGSFYQVSFGGNAIEALISDLDRLEKSNFENAEMVDYGENFQLPLFFAILFGLIELALGERKKTGRLWRGRFEVSQS